MYLCCATVTTGKSAVIATYHRSFICCVTLVCYSVLRHRANLNPINILAAVTLLCLISFAAFIKLSFGHNRVARGQYEHTLSVAVSVWVSLCVCSLFSHLVIWIHSAGFSLTGNSWADREDYLQVSLTQDA